MPQNSPPPIPSPAYQPSIPETTPAAIQFPADDPTTTSLFDWSDFLDFNLDDNLNISFPHHESEQPEHPGVDQSQSPETPGRIRKRDPRLVCTNFLAGMIPCACPELDEKIEAEENSALPGKKRPRMLRAPGGAPARCQVPGCEADISELKGYHKRHRVCLRCANASEVVLDGESKRYCQQCGKFHVLSDFDEGKRSCRRKLERHNNRRRRKPGDSKGGSDKDHRQIILVDDVSGDDDTGKDGTCFSSQIEEKDVLLESDGHVSTRSSAQDSQNFQSDSGVSFAASGEIPVEGEKHNLHYKGSPSYFDNKSAFSSACPSGRISFKLYDWNPAEFPRRLRHQIFQWLASMPIELEGYIRPGCTILTAFIAMPKSMWHKLLEDPALHIRDLIVSPGNMLSGRGSMRVYLNDMIFRVAKDSTSVVKVELKDRAPKLHYVYPTCFEAGRPMEFVACGSDLLQPKFRFLVSFAGRYLAYNLCVSSLGEKRDAYGFDHQLLKIHVPLADMDLHGPAFIEVENHSGISNFIPILVGDKETCAEMEILQQKFDPPLPSEEQQFSPPRPPCKVLASRQAQFSEFVLDVAWSLKRPVSEQQLTTFHLQRFNNLLNSLIEKNSSAILERVFCSLRYAINKNLVAEVPDSDMRLLRQTMDIVQNVLDKRLQERDLSLVRASGNSCSQNLQNDNPSVPATILDFQRKPKNMLGVKSFSSPLDECATVPLLNREVVMDVNLQENPGKTSRLLLTRTLFTPRIVIVAIAAIGICSGICAVVLHPQRVSHITTTIRRCLLDRS